MILKPLKPFASNAPFLYSIFINSFSLTSHSHSSSSYIRARDEESKNIRVCVWWDFENCGIPPSVNVFRVAQSITGAVRANGIKGPVQITAFGDVFQLSRASQVALSATGVNMNHVPNGGKNSADRSLLVDLMCWVSQNAPPAHLFLISGDRDFANILHRLRMNNYNVLLASRGDVPNVLCSAASIMWNWSDLVRGENLNGRHFNQPPDGPHGSWYGHFRVPLEDPFLIDEQSLRTEEVHEENSEISTTDTKPRQIPAAVLKQVHQILSLHPKGIAITELRSELTKSNVSIPKDLYGHKKFLRFLMSMHEILKLRNTGDGQFIVCGINTKAQEPFDGNRCTSSNHANAVADNGNPQISESIVKDKDLHVPRSDGETTALHPSSEKNLEKHPNNAHQPFPPVEKGVEVDCIKEVRQPPNTNAEVSDLDDAQVAEPHMHPLKEQTSRSGTGIFRSIWKNWFSGRQKCEMKIHDTSENVISAGKNSDQKSRESLEIHVSSSCASMTKETKKGILKSPWQEDCPAHPISHISASGVSVEENKIENNLKPNGEKFNKHPGLFSRIRNWLRYWSSPKSSAIGRQFLAEQQEQQKFEEAEQQKQHVFSDDSFWKDVRDFISTPMGSLVILQSRTRKQLARKLQSQGPSTVRSLDENEILKLVDLLIFQKKWVEESPSKFLPFKLSHSMNTSPVNPRAAASGLSSIFLNKSESTLKSTDKRIQNAFDPEVSAPVRQKWPTEKSRNAVLVDCQQLLNDILEEFPNGYNMGGFRKLFLERYGYPLEVQQLGYEKLASLLQIMAGVKIESTLIIPSRKASESSSSDVNPKLPNFDTKLYDPLGKDDESDSMWEELGPVDNISTGRKQPLMETHYEFEPSFSDDYSSESEGENSDLNASVVKAKAIINDQDSSLLQILGSWYSKDAEDRTANLVGKDDCSSNGMPIFDSSRLGTKTMNSLQMRSQLSRSQKHISFVADSVVEQNQKQVDDILVSLKKSNESRMQT